MSHTRSWLGRRKRRNHLRRQKITLKKIISSTVTALTKNPALPIQNGPGGTYFLPESRCGAIARPYDVVVRMMKEPTISWKAVLEPSGMAPMAVQRTAGTEFALVE